MRLKPVNVPLNQFIEHVFKCHISQKSMVHGHVCNKCNTISVLVHHPSDEIISQFQECAPLSRWMLELCSWDFNEMILLLDNGCKESKTGGIWVCLKIGYIPNYSRLIGIMIINHWVHTFLYFSASLLVWWQGWLLIWGGFLGLVPSSDFLSSWIATSRTSWNPIIAIEASIF